jgi:hypothetical protein
LKGSLKDDQYRLKHGLNRKIRVWVPEPCVPKVRDHFEGAVLVIGPPPAGDTGMHSLERNGWAKHPHCPEFAKRRLQRKVWRQ